MTTSWIGRDSLPEWEIGERAEREAGMEAVAVYVGTLRWVLVNRMTGPKQIGQGGT